MEILVAIVALITAFIFGKAKGKRQQKQERFEEDVKDLNQRAHDEDERHRREDENIQVPEPVDDADSAMDRLNERFGGSGDSEG